MTPQEWLNRLGDRGSFSAIAESVGKSTSTVTRWANGEAPLHAHHIIEIARAQGVPVLEALVELKYVEPEEIESIVKEVSIRTFPIEAMAEEIHRRATVARYRLGGISQHVSMIRESDETGPVRELADWISVALGEYQEEVTGAWYGVKRWQCGTQAWLTHPTSAG